MPSTASSLRDLHQLHQRAKALRDRLTSGPKTLAARQAAAATRQVKLDEAKKALQDEKLTISKLEAQVQTLQAKNDDLLVKQKMAKKNDEYKALGTQMETNQASIARVEGQTLEAMERIAEREAVVAAADAEVKKFAADVAALAAQIEANSGTQQAQLAELEAAIVEAESFLDGDTRDRYRRTVKQRGADSLAAVEGGACSGCYQSVTGQVMNELINGQNLQFCMSCGRMLYMVDDEHTVRRS